MFKEIGQVIKRQWDNRLPLFLPKFDNLNQVNIKGNQYSLQLADLTMIDDFVDVSTKVYAGVSPWTVRDFIFELANTANRLYLALLFQNKIVAFIGVAYIRYRRNLHIMNISVLPDFQNQGIGSFLLEQIIAYAKKWQLDTLTLEVRKSNVGAQQLYERLGFFTEEIKKGYYTDTNEDSYHMVLKLK